MTTGEASQLRDLEESLWRSETRFNPEYMERILASDFFEFGRSGRVYQRQDTLNVPSLAVIHAKLPLNSFQAKLIADGIALITYISEVLYGDVIECANRSSLWCETPHGWQIKFHQGTPFTKED